MITTTDLIGTYGMAEALSAGSEIKIVDGEGDLIAILKYKEPGQRLAYHCVFPKQEKRQIG